MEYRLLVNQIEKTLTVTSSPDLQQKIAFLDGARHQFQIGSIGAHEFLLDLDGRLVPFYLARDDSKTHIFIQGETFAVEDQAAGRIKRKEHPDDLARLVTPPMPATVIRILVVEGERVNRGQALMVLSAMKMETTLVAPYRGLTTRVNAAQGAQVMPGDILVEIEQDEEVQNGVGANL